MMEGKNKHQVDKDMDRASVVTEDNIKSTISEVENLDMIAVEEENARQILINNTSDNQNTKGTENNNLPRKQDDSSIMCQLLKDPPIRGIFIQPLSGAPVVFGIRSGRDLESIRMHIWKGGGKVEDPRTISDTTGQRITLFDPNALIRPKNKEIFDYKYILDCVRENVLKENLMDYRINKKLVFEDYDPMDILLGNKKWNDLKKRISLLDQSRQEDECSDIDDDMGNNDSKDKPTEASRNNVDSTNDGNEQTGNPNSKSGDAIKKASCDESNQTEDESASSSPRKQRFVLKRHPYSKQEQQQIVDYIISTKSYKFIKGVQLWQEMYKDGSVCKGRRTWQSMKEHFHKQIVPQLHIYKNVNEKVANCFKRVLMGLNIDVEDSDSSEEKENHEKKKSQSTRDVFDRDAYMSGSDSELNTSYKSTRKRITLDTRPHPRIARQKSVSGMSGSSKDSMYRPVVRAHENEQCATRVYVQKHFSNPDVRGVFQRVNSGKERLHAIRESAYEDDNDSILSYGSGSIRSSARSPRKKVKLWHPSQDTVSPFLNESTERNMRRKLNATNAMDNSTQTPEKNRDPITISLAPTGLLDTDLQNKKSKNTLISSSPSKERVDGEETPTLPEKRRALNFEVVDSNPKTSHAVRNLDTFEPQQSTSKETGNNKSGNIFKKSKRISSIDSLSSSEDYHRDEIGIINNSETSQDERINDEHVFLRPKTYCKNSRQRSDQFGFLGNSTAHKLKSRDMKTSKSSRSFTSNTESPWRKADEAAGEDISWAPTSFRRLSKHTSSTSDEDYSRSRRGTKSRKMRQKSTPSEDGNSVSSDGSSKSHQQRYYQREEEVKILAFIIQHQAFSQVKGNTLWKIMEATQVLPERTSQSMKERFRRHIFPKLGKYDHLSEQDISNFKNPPKADHENIPVESNTSAATIPRSVSGRVETDSSNVERDESRIDDDNVSVISSSSNRTNTSIMSGSKQGRSYSRQEEIAILNFIVTNRRFSEVNGNTLWALMETKKIVENRSWQSMKERFRRHMAPNLDRYTNLTAKDISQLNKYLSVVSKQIKKKLK